MCGKTETILYEIADFEEFEKMADKSSRELDMDDLELVVAATKIEMPDYRLIIDMAKKRWQDE